MDPSQTGFGEDKLEEDLRERRLNSKVNLDLLTGNRKWEHKLLTGGDKINFVKMMSLRSDMKTNWTSSYSDLRFLLGELCCEIHCRSDQVIWKICRDVIEEEGYLQFDKKVGSNTPDLSSNGYYYEFKTKIGRFRTEEEVSITEKITSKYGSKGSIIFIEINDHFYRKYKVPAQIRNFMEAILTVLSLKERPKDSNDDKVETTKTKMTKMLNITGIEYSLKDVKIQAQGEEELFKSMLKNMEKLDDQLSDDHVNIADVLKLLPEMKPVKKFQYINKGLGSKKLTNTRNMEGILRGLPSTLYDKEGLLERLIPVKLKMIEEMKIIKEIQKLNKEISIVKGDVEGEMKRKIAKERGIAKTMFLEAHLKEVREKLSTELNAKCGTEKCFINKRGLMVPIGITELLENLGVGKRVTKPVKNLDDQEDLTVDDAGKVLDEVVADYPQSTVSFDHDCPDYGSEDIDLLIKMVDEESREHLGTIFNSSVFGVLLYYFRLHRELAGVMDKVAQKGSKENSFGIFKHPDKDICFVSSRSPSESTTGLMYAFGTCSEEFPKGCNKVVYERKNGVLYFRTAPFRLNAKVLSNTFEEFGCFFASSLEYLKLGCNILGDNLYKSMFIDVPLSITPAAVTVYSVGKIIGCPYLFASDLKKKLSKTRNEDPRVFLMMKRFRERIRETLTKVESMEDEFEDPVFNITHKGLQSYLVTVYMKNWIPKDIGQDAKRVVSDAASDEIDHNTEFMRSKFHPSNYRWFEDRDYLYFDENLFEETEKGQEWVTNSFSTQAIVGQVNKLFEKWKEEGKDVRANFLDDVMAEEKYKNSKILVFKDDPVLKGHPFAERSRYKTVFTMPLKDAILLNTTQYFDETKCWPTIFELLMWRMSKQTKKGLAMYNMTVLLVNKIQRGLGRAFQEQDFDSWLLNMTVDNSLRPFLSMLEVDMLLDEGDKKNVVVERKIGSIMKDGGSGNVEDFKRFGDTFMIEACKALLHALYQNKYYTKEEAAIVEHSMTQLINRVILMPSDLISFYERVKKTKNGTISEAVERSMQNYINTQEWAKIHSRDCQYGKVEDPFTVKTLGFVLGVFNVFGSAMSAISGELCLKFTRRFFPDIKVNKVTHSDDGAGAIATDMPAAFKKISEMQVRVSVEGNDWKSLKGTKIKKNTMMFDFLHEVSQNNLELVRVKSDEKGTVGYRAVLKGAIMTVFILSEDITIVSYVSGLITGRYFGMRASLAKWFLTKRVEVLQTMVTELGTVYIPAIREMGAFLTDLGTSSPSEDLSAGMGRIYSAFAHGHTVSYLHSCLIALNYFVALKYGTYEGKQIMIKFNKPTEIGGGSYVFPPFIFYHGFSGNTVRLLNKSGSDGKLKNMMMLTYNAKENFKQKDFYKKLRVPDSDFKIDEVPDGLFVRRRWPMVFSVDTRGKMSLLYMQSKVEPTLKHYEAALKDKIEGDLAKRYKAVSSKLREPALKGTRDSGFIPLSSVDKMSRAAHSNNSARIPTSTKIIGTAGYYNRVVSNPFVNEPDEDMTIKDVWKRIEEKANDGFDANEKVRMLFEFEMKIYQQMVNIVKSFKLKDKQINLIAVLGNGSYTLKYGLVRTENNLKIGPKLAELAIAYSVYWWDGGSENSEALTVNIPNEVIRIGFEARVRQYVTEFKMLGFTKREIDEKRDLFVSLISENKMKIYTKIADDRDPIRTSLKHSFMTNIMSDIDFTVIYNPTNYQKITRYSVGTRIMMFELFNKGIEFYYDDKLMKVYKSESMWDSLLDNKELDKEMCSYAVMYMIKNRKFLRFKRFSSTEWVINLGETSVMRDEESFFFNGALNGFVGLLFCIGNQFLSKSGDRRRFAEVQKGEGLSLINGNSIRWSNINKIDFNLSANELFIEDEDYLHYENDAGFMTEHKGRTFSINPWVISRQGSGLFYKGKDGSVKIEMLHDLTFPGFPKCPISDKLRDTVCDELTEIGVVISKKQASESLTELVKWQCLKVLIETRKSGYESLNDWMISQNTYGGGEDVELRRLELAKNALLFNMMKIEKTADKMAERVAKLKHLNSSIALVKSKLGRYDPRKPQKKEKKVFSYKQTSATMFVERHNAGLDFYAVKYQANCITGEGDIEDIFYAALSLSPNIGLKISELDDLQEVYEKEISEFDNFVLTEEISPKTNTEMMEFACENSGFLNVKMLLFKTRKQLETIDQKRMMEICSIIDENLERIIELLKEKLEVEIMTKKPYEDNDEEILDCFQSLLEIEGTIKFFNKSLAESMTDALIKQRYMLLVDEYADED